MEKASAAGSSTAFDTASEPPIVPLRNAGRERRAAKRIDVHIRSRLAYGDFCFQAVQIDNLSFTGFRARCSLRLRTNDRVSLDLPSIGLVRGTIAWASESHVGGMFDKAVDIRKTLRSERSPV